MIFLTGDAPKQPRRRPIRTVAQSRVLAFLPTAGVLLLILVAVTAGAAGCGVGSEVGDTNTVSTTERMGTTTSTLPPVETSTTVPAQTTTTVAGDTMTVNVYFSTNEICAATRVIPKTQQVGTAAMKALLAGPTAEEEAAGMLTNIPEGTTFLGLIVEDGVATVDLSREYASGGGSWSMIMRLAQVVFTLTQFPTVEGVNFELGGEPVGVFGGEGFFLDHPLDRSEYEDLTPAIFVESPTLGNTVSAPLRITGTANVFEGVFRVNLVDQNGLIVADQVVQATSGTGTRGTFNVTVPFTVEQGGPADLVLFAESPKDGSRTDVVEIPLVLEKP